VLVGTDRKIGTGFDEATACANYRGRPSDLVIICNSIKKVARLIQNAGRGFRADKVNIMHLIDDDSILESHWKGNEDWYRSVKATIVQAQVSLS